MKNINNIIEDTYQEQEVNDFNYYNDFTNKLNKDRYDNRNKRIHKK